VPALHPSPRPRRMLAGVFRGPCRRARTKQASLAGADAAGAEAAGAEAAGAMQAGAATVRNVGTRGNFCLRRDDRVQCGHGSRARCRNLRAQYIFREAALERAEDFEVILPRR
jgi:hypothetical protein